MCGLAGIYDPERKIHLSADVNCMIGALAHRGPDDAGIWTDELSGIAFGHRRLSILDLSPAGHQPIHSACGRFVLVFNGEIYNHLVLRADLDRLGKSPAWRGHADTETLLACFAAWGIEQTLQATVGMFAIAIWDKQEKILTLARDRMGEKPLYWGWQDNVLLFGSELKALKANPAFRTRIDRNALTLLLRYGYIPAPYSIYQGIQKLRPSHYINIPLGDVNAARKAQPVAFWNFKDVVNSGLANLFTGTAAEAVDAMEQQLTTSISAQMLADVPLGAFLSGGVDSSTIVALMQAQSRQPIQTFTIGFNEPSYNEAAYAQAVAKHLGTQHTELYVSPDDALAVIPRLPEIYCEPFADSSQIPTFLVSQLARQHVTVALSGDGGDELFGGYNTYQFTPAIWSMIRLLPVPLRRFASELLRELLLPAKAHNLLAILDSSNREKFFWQMISHWKQPANVVIGANEPVTLLNDPDQWPQTDAFEHWMMAMDAQVYMADDILVKVDRAAMANSLETRVPLLDHRVAELAWRMPLDFKIRKGKNKWLIREILYRHVPKKLIERPKKGFSIPLAKWLRNPLRDWVEVLLDENRLRQETYLHPELIRKLWVQHLSGQFDHSTKLWIVLMFQAWLETQ